jgi:2-polyprenyl-6-methoxyphenol hydroxylase-like FAD-dependent oxidoreductase
MKAITKAWREWFDHGRPCHAASQRSHVSAVLTLPSHEIDRIAALPRDALGQELTRRYHRQPGAMQVVTDLRSIRSPYRRRHFAATRAALIGDAAVHAPVTAHGQQALRGRSPCRSSAAAARGRDIGSSLLLRRYEAGIDLRADRSMTRPR